MPAHICTTCGTQYPEADNPPAGCTICQEQRQYVNPLGQAWTTLSAMRRTYFNAFRQHEPGLIGIGTMPAFAIAQRALLLRTPAGNILWDCISFIDDATVEIVRSLGGIAAIAISHPHYYSSMVEWSHAFGGAPIHLHAADRQWVMRPDPAVTFWDGETQGTRSRRHAAPLRRPFRRRHGAALGARRRRQGRAAVGRHRAGAARQEVSFMRSYPDLIPLDANSVRHIAGVLEPWPFDPVYGAWWDRVIPAGGKAALALSVKRYLAAIGGPLAD